VAEESRRQGAVSGVVRHPENRVGPAANGLRTCGLKNIANTHCWCGWATSLLALWEASSPHALDPGHPGNQRPST